MVLMQLSGLPAMMTPRSGEEIGVKLGHCSPGRTGAAVQRNAGLGGLGLVFLIGLAQPAPEVGLQVFWQRHPTLPEVPRRR